MNTLTSKIMGFQERKIRAEAQEAAVRFERANSMLQVAKQQVKLTQDSLGRQKSIEVDCLEVNKDQCPLIIPYL